MNKDELQFSPIRAGNFLCDERNSKKLFIQKQEIKIFNRKFSEKK